MKCLRQAMLTHIPGPVYSDPRIIRRRAGPHRVAPTSNRSAAGKNSSARSSSTKRRPGGSCCSTAARTIGPKAVCATGFRGIGYLFKKPASTGNVTPVM